MDEPPPAYDSVAHLGGSLRAQPSLSDSRQNSGSSTASNAALERPSSSGPPTPPSKGDSEARPGRVHHPTASEVLARDQKPPIVSSRSPSTPPSPTSSSSSPNPQLSPAHRSSSNLTKAQSKSAALLSSPPPSLRSKSSSSWFRNSQQLSKETSQEITSTVINLLRDLVRPSPSLPSSADPDKVLAGCREACALYKLDFCAFVQQKCIEGHSALYWAVLNSNDPSLPLTLLKFAQPLLTDVSSEIRSACLLRNDQALFQRLRTEGGVVPQSGVDEMLGGTELDNVLVKETHEEGEFTVDMQLGYFQRRMRIKGEVVVEWIASNRLWNLTFNSLPVKDKEPQRWTITLSLFEDSQPTFVDANLYILDHHRSANNRQRSPISIPIHTSGPHELIPTTSKKKKQEKASYILIDLEKGVEPEVKESIGMSAGTGPSYLSPTDGLHLQFAVKMRMFEEKNGCIIC